MPYAQGELDGLCGVYAIVNAVENTVAGWKKEDANGLFNHLVTRLSGQGRLHTAMADGIGVRELCRLIDHAGAYLADEYGLSLKRHIAFARRVPLSSYWKRLQEHLQCRGHTAIIGLWGKYEHWSCVHSMSGHTVHLLDSGWEPIRRIYRANCTTGRISGRRRHELAVTQTVFVFLNNYHEV
jgi:hypothetical protein